MQETRPLYYTSWTSSFDLSCTDETALALFIFLPASVERYEKRDASGADTDMSPVYWFTGVTEEKPEKGGKSLCHAAMQ